MNSNSYSYSYIFMYIYIYIYIYIIRCYIPREEARVETRILNGVSGCEEAAREARCYNTRTPCGMI